MRFYNKITSGLFVLNIFFFCACSNSSQTSKIIIKGFSGHSSAITQSKNSDSATVIESCPNSSTTRRFTNISDSDFVYFSASGKFGSATVQFENGVPKVMNHGATRISYANGEVNLEIPSSGEISFFSLTSKSYIVATNAEKVEEDYWTSKTILAKPGTQIIDLPLQYKGYKQTVKLFMKLYDVGIPVTGPLSLTVFDPSTGLFTVAEDVGQYDVNRPGLYEFDFPSGLSFALKSSTGKTLFSFNDVTDIYKMTETQMSAKGFYTKMYKSSAELESCFTTPSTLLLGFGVSVDPLGDENADGVLNQESLNNDIDPLFSRNNYGGYSCPSNQTCPTSGSINISIYPSTQTQTFDTSEVNNNGTCPARTVQIINNTNQDLQNNFSFENDATNDEIFGHTSCGNPFLGQTCPFIAKGGGVGYAKVRFCPRSVGNKSGWIAIRSGNVRSNVLGFTGVARTQVPAISRSLPFINYYAKPGFNTGSLVLGYAEPSITANIYYQRYFSNDLDTGVFQDYFPESTNSFLDTNTKPKDMAFEIIPPVLFSQDKKFENLLYYEASISSSHFSYAYRPVTGASVVIALNPPQYLYNSDENISFTKMEWAYTGNSYPNVFFLKSETSSSTCQIENLQLSGTPIITNEYTVGNPTYCKSAEISSDHNDVAFTFRDNGPNLSAYIGYRSNSIWTLSPALGTNIYRIDNDIGGSTRNDGIKSIYTIHKETPSANASNIVVSEINVNDIPSITTFPEIGRFDDLPSDPGESLKPQIAIGMGAIPYIAYYNISTNQIIVKRFTFVNSSTRSWQTIASISPHMSAFLSFSFVKDRIHKKIYLVTSEYQSVPTMTSGIFTTQIR